MTYEQAVDKLFQRHRSVQSAGFSPESYKPGLDAMARFDDALGNPSRCLRCIHVAGTNGKGSVSSMLAAALSASGYRVGLYTSPHLVDFRERMKILDGGSCAPVSREYVLDFLTRCDTLMQGLSFFEITTGMAFSWFADRKVDWAVIETGLGGRLDSTNIIVPEISVITSIGLDHCAILGDTRAAIAAEKAGIFKSSVPALVAACDPETEPVFRAAASRLGSPLYFADSYKSEAAAFDSPSGEQPMSDAAPSRKAASSLASAGLRNSRFALKQSSPRDADACRSSAVPLFSGPPWTSLSPEVSDASDRGAGEAERRLPIFANFVLRDTKLWPVEQKKAEFSSTGQLRPGVRPEGIAAERIRLRDEGAQRLSQNVVASCKSPDGRPGVAKESIVDQIAWAASAAAPSEVSDASDRGAGEAERSRMPLTGAGVQPGVAKESIVDQIYDTLDLKGPGQRMNLRTALCALQILGQYGPAAATGLQHFGELSCLRGRWEKICDAPEVICDIGHNPPALELNFARLERMRAQLKGRRPLTVVYGVMRDKDLGSILHLFPEDAKYIFCVPSTPRALGASELLRTVRTARPELDCVVGPDDGSVREAVLAAYRDAVKACGDGPVPIIYVGGSTFVVSEALSIDKELLSCTSYDS